MANEIERGREESEIPNETLETEGNLYKSNKARNQTNPEGGIPNKNQYLM